MRLLLFTLFLSTSLQLYCQSVEVMLGIVMNNDGQPIPFAHDLSL